MQDKIKSIIISIGFIIILFVIFVVNIVSKDKEISMTERRKLAQFPEISLNKMLKGDLVNKWEKYVEDQFVERDLFRGIKAFWSKNIFIHKDNNQLFEKDGAIYKMEYPLKEKNIQKSAQKIKDVYDKYLKGMNVYYSIIPDKNYYLKNDDHLKLDYNRIQQIVKSELEELTYIDIKDGLKVEDYYRTDLHWKQENLKDVVKIIQSNMELNSVDVEYEVINVGEFKGAYYGQLVSNISPDNIYVLTNNIIKNCTTYNYETKKNASIYTNSNSGDRYDVFLSGATPIISIDNPNAKNNKELILFRDSFGSSIAPLLIENYRKITLVDIRYISSKLLSEFIEFNDQDVLFLYSTIILNQNILK